ncbi:hypothetical protein SKAU_G00184440 [Synaphobranchus kaupii]|uniref:Uncharacterized protein n=1 Tax=Synaphobranchus kaupii TaxID=118154 RepID=A0A9Q1FC79_SYNKA|nr:hypothetical protein SKAU_G00184440 [Synaphobranchus kaupii]
MKSVEFASYIRKTDSPLRARLQVRTVSLLSREPLCRHLIPSPWPYLFGRGQDVKQVRLAVRWQRGAKCAPPDSCDFVHSSERAHVGNR